MLYEYAVEPACLGNWQTFRYLIEQFGVSRGRLVSQFPKEWPRLVYESSSTFTFGQKQKLQIELERLKKHGLIRSGRTYDGAKVWSENALFQQREGNPFHAVIFREHQGEGDDLLVADELSQLHPRWAVKRQDRVARTADSLGAAAHGLLQIGGRILFIDKMFMLAGRQGPWQVMLEKFVMLALQNRSGTLPEFEYHTTIDNDEYGKPEAQRTADFQVECNRLLSGLLPNGVRLQVVRWDRHYQGDFFHERCILTEKGGLQIDWGLDVGKPGETTLVSLLEDETWRQSWSNFQRDSKTFRFLDEAVVHGCKNG